MNGLLLINKDKNMTSRDVINKLNHIFSMKKIGHTGTLDPLATGVMVCLFGKYTKPAYLCTQITPRFTPMNRMFTYGQREKLVPPLQVQGKRIVHIHWFNGFL